MWDWNLVYTIPAYLFGGVKILHGKKIYPESHKILNIDAGKRRLTTGNKMFRLQGKNVIEELDYA